MDKFKKKNGVQEPKKDLRQRTEFRPYWQIK